MPAEFHIDPLWTVCQRQSNRVAMPRKPCADAQLNVGQCQVDDGHDDGAQMALGPLGDRHKEKNIAAIPKHFLSLGMFFSSDALRQELHLNCTSTNRSLNVPKPSTLTKQSDRHRAGHVILSFRVPGELRSRFATHCHDRGVTPSDVLRELMAAILKVAKHE